MSKRAAKGAALVELAILLPLLIMMAFGITELGRALYQRNILGKNTDVAARYMARSWEAVTAECNQDSNWTTAVDTASRLGVYGNESGSGDALLPSLSTSDFDIQVSPVVIPASGETACVISVSANVAFQGVFGEYMVPFTRIEPVTLSATREVRYLGE